MICGGKKERDQCLKLDGQSSRLCILWGMFVVGEEKPLNVKIFYNLLGLSLNFFGIRGVFIFYSD